MTDKLLVVINKDEGYLGPSETFLWAHINSLPYKVTPLIGNPGRRCLDIERKIYIPSRSIIPLGLRWLLRKFRLSSVAAQDNRALARFIHRNKFRAVLAEYGNTAASIVDACNMAGVPLIAHFHGWDAYSEYMLNTYAQGYKKLFVSASVIVAVSTDMRKQLICLGANPDSVIHNACGAEIPPNTRANPATSGKRFLIVGRLTEKKAPIISILAFSRVAKDYPDAILEIIGEGPLKHTCIQLAQGLGLADRVIFHGAQPHNYVLQALTTARCFIQHSVRAPSGDCEGTPVGVLEAMGMGLPVVSTRHGGILDIIDEGVTGKLVDEYDLEGMADAMKLFAADASLAQQIGSKARKAVLAEWSNEKSIGRLGKIIENAIENRSHT